MNQPQPAPPAPRRPGKIAAARKRLRNEYIRLLRSEGAPSQIGGGVALGLLIGMMPIMGLQMPVAVAVAEALRRLFGTRLSRTAAAAGVWITNPLTAAPIYALTYWVGSPFASVLLAAERGTLQYLPEDQQPVAPSAAGPVALEVIAALVVGGLILGIPLAFAGYHLTVRAVVRYQQRRLRRRARDLGEAEADSSESIR